MFDIILAPFKAIGEFIIWGLIIYGVVQMAQLVAFCIRGYYTLKFMKHAASLVADLATQIAELRRELPHHIAQAETRLNIQPPPRPVPPPLPPREVPPPLPPRLLVER